NSTTRGSAAFTVLQGAGSAASTFYRLLSTDQDPVPIGDYQGGVTPPGYYLPNNGMVTGQLQVEPFTGNGGPGPAGATFTPSSEYKVNDADPSQNFCHISGQIVGPVQ